MTLYLKRGQVYYIDLGVNEGSEVNGVRPCIIVQNDIGNKHSPTTIVIPISHRSNGEKNKRILPTQFILKSWMQESGFKYLDGIVMAEQIKTIDKTRIQSLAGALLPETMNKVDNIIKVSLGIK